MKLLSNRDYHELLQKVQLLEQELQNYRSLEEARISFEKCLSNSEIKMIEGLPLNILSAMINSMKSTKNALLLDQKKAHNPEAIAIRDGAILFADMIIRKLMLNIAKTEQKQKSE